MIDKGMTVLADSFGGFELANHNCPRCGNPLYTWKVKNTDGSSRCGPTCINKNCGYKEMITKNQREMQQKAIKAKQHDAINRMRNSSLITDEGIWNYDFKNYKKVDNETTVAYNTMIRWVKEILGGSTMKCYNH